MSEVTTFSAVTSDVSTLVEHYRAADAKGKGAVRSELNSALRDAIRALDMAAATDAQTKLDAVKVAVTPAAKVVDWSELVSVQLVTLKAAVYALENGKAVLVDEEATYEVSDDVEVNSDLFNTLTTFKSGRSGKVNDVSAFITAATSTKPDTFFKVSEMRATSPEGPGAGAISAALNAVLDGKREIENVTVSHDANGRLGATFTE